MFVEVEGHARVYAIADEDLDRENDEKTSAVHFVRFEFRRLQRGAVRAGAQRASSAATTPTTRRTCTIAPETLGQPGRRSAIVPTEAGTSPCAGTR